MIFKRKNIMKIILLLLLLINQNSYAFLLDSQRLVDGYEKRIKKEKRCDVWRKEINAMTSLPSGDASTHHEFQKFLIKVQNDDCLLTEQEARLQSNNPLERLMGKEIQKTQDAKNNLKAEKSSLRINYSSQIKNEERCQKYFDKFYDVAKSTDKIDDYSHAYDIAFKDKCTK